MKSVMQAYSMGREKRKIKGAFVKTLTVIKREIYFYKKKNIYL